MKKKPSSSKLPTKDFQTRQDDLQAWIEKTLECKLSVPTETAQSPKEQNGKTKEGAAKQKNGLAANSPYKLQNLLMDGVALCRLMEKIQPGSIPQIHEKGLAWPLKVKENLIFFVTAVEEFGIARHRKFQIQDVLDATGTKFYRVVECLEDLQELSSMTSPGSPMPASLQSLFQLDVDLLHGGASEARPKSIAPNDPNQLHPSQNSESPTEIRLVRRVVSIYCDAHSSNVRMSMASTLHLRIVKEFSLLPESQKTKVEKGFIQLQARIRGRIARQAYQKRLTYNAYRRRVAEEILTTEKIYVNNLQILSKVYLNPLKDMLQKGNPVIKEAALKEIFSPTLQVIINYNTKFLTELEPKISNWSPSQCIGNVFIQITSFMKAYTQYVLEYSRAIETFEKERAKPKFSTFLQNCAAQHPEIEGRTLPDFLILPIQRIPRYELLLKDMAKHTWAEHLDYANLNEALKKMEEVALYLNERKKDHDQRDKVVELEKKLVGKFQRLVDPSRKLVREGILTVITGSQSSGTVPEIKDREVFLFSDKILIAKKTYSKNLSLTRKGTFSKEGMKIIIFEDLLYCTLVVDESYPTSFVINLSKGSIKCISTSRADRDEWVAAIRAAKDLEQERKDKNRENALQRSREKAESAKEQIQAFYSHDNPAHPKRPRALTDSKQGTPPSEEAPTPQSTQPPDTSPRTRARTVTSPGSDSLGKKTKRTVETIGRSLKAKKSLSDLFSQKS